MIVSQANSIRFREVNSDLSGFDNTLLADEKFYNDKIETYCQRWQTTDTETVIVKSDTATVPTVTVTNEDNSTSVITASPLSSYDQDADSVDDLFFFSFSVVFSSYLTESFITVVQDGTTYKSEPFKGDSDLTTELSNGDVLKIEYTNEDNAFQIDFSKKVVYTIYVAAIAKDYDFGGEQSIYDNQDEIEKLKESVQRLLSFRTLNIPRYLAETLKLASSMDSFVVNDIAFVRTEQPELTIIEGSNLVDFSMLLTDKEYLGVNSHDIGFDCDTITGGDGVSNLKEDNASGSVTFAIPAGRQIHTLRAQWVSGTVSVKLGTTIGGDELVYPFNISTTFTDTTVAIHGDISRDSDASVYATVTGGVANLDLMLLRNIQE